MNACEELSKRTLHILFVEYLYTWIIQYYNILRLEAVHNHIEPSLIIGTYRYCGADEIARP